MDRKRKRRRGGLARIRSKGGKHCYGTHAATVLHKGLEMAAPPPLPPRVGSLWRAGDKEVLFCLFFLLLLLPLTVMKLLFCSPAHE